MNELWKSRWNLLTKRDLRCFMAGLAVFIALLATSEPGFIRILDSANLLFHEAGHPFYGLFSERLTVYGGTMGQLTFPVVLAVIFWRRREPVSVAASVIWFFENGLNIARYLADARSQVLPLVGGGEHDWTEILGRWHLRRYDTRIAFWMDVVCFTAMALTVIWILALWFATAKERSQNDLSDDGWKLTPGVQTKFKTLESGLPKPSHPRLETSETVSQTSDTICR